MHHPAPLVQEDISTRILGAAVTETVTSALQVPSALSVHRIALHVQRVPTALVTEQSALGLALHVQPGRTVRPVHHLVCHVLLAVMLPLVQRLAHFVPWANMSIIQEVVSVHVYHVQRDLSVVTQVRHPAHHARLERTNLIQQVRLVCHALLIHTTQTLEVRA